MNNEINGTITNVLPLQSGTSQGGKDWQKQDVIIKTDGEYPKDVCVTFFGKAITNDLQQGAKIRVSINIESREFNGKWYTNVNAYKILEIDSATQTYTPQPIKEPFMVDDNQNFDLPF